MRKLIAGINMTLDGFCDHTAITPDAEIHNHYADQLRSADTAIFGRITYQLMTFWQDLLNNPSGEKSMDDFAASIDGIRKIVFSNTLKTLGWQTAELAKQELKEEVLALRQQPGGDILVSSRSIIIQLLNHRLIDELQLCVHPVIAGSGLPLFEKVSERIELTLTKTKPFSGGAVVFYYKPKRD